MKPFTLLVAVAAAAIAGGCNADRGNESSNSPVTAEVVPPPQGGDWSKMVRQTPEGGFLMGNPNAAVKLVEFGSMTCPHCATFDKEGAPQLIEKYVKAGQVSFEFRNFVRDQFDMAASLIARCGGPDRFFPLTHAMFADQERWMQQLQTVPEQRLQGLTSLPPSQMFVQVAQLAGFQQWAAQRGLPSARANACLANEAEVNRLVQINSDTVGQFPNMPGTPSFLINGEMVENAADWESLEPQIRKALGD